MCFAAIIFVSVWMFLSFRTLPSLIEYIFSVFGFSSVGQFGWLTIVSWSANLLALALGVLLSPFIVGIFSIPLCTPLANSVDAHLNPSLEFSSPNDWVRQWILSATLPLIVGLVGNVLLMVLSFLPVIGSLFGFVAFFIWSPLNLGFAIVENSLDRRGHTFGSKISFVKRFLAASWLIGFQAQILFTIPFLNLVGCPLVIMSGVKTVSDLLKIDRQQAVVTT